MLLTNQSPKTSPIRDNIAWKQWDTFCTWLRIPDNVQGIRDPIPFLQIFSHKVRTCVLAANHKPIHKQSVDKYICYMIQNFAAVGSPYPRLNTMGAIDFRLG